MFKLSLSAASDPFPFAAIVLASFVKNVAEVKVEYDRDDAACVLTRTADGTQIEESESVVRALAKEAGVESNSTQVRIIIFVNLHTRTHICH